MKIFLTNVYFLLYDCMVLLLLKIWCLIVGHDNQQLGFESRVFTRCQRCGGESWKEKNQ